MGTWSPDNDGALEMRARPATGCRVPQDPPPAVRFARVSGGVRGALRRVDRPSQRHLRMVPSRGPRGIRAAAALARDLGWRR